MTANSIGELKLPSTVMINDQHSNMLKRPLSTDCNQIQLQNHAVGVPMSKRLATTGVHPHPINLVAGNIAGLHPAAFGLNCAAYQVLSGSPSIGQSPQHAVSAAISAVNTLPQTVGSDTIPTAHLPDCSSTSMNLVNGYQYQLAAMHAQAAKLQANHAQQLLQQMQAVQNQTHALTRMRAQAQIRAKSLLPSIQPRCDVSQQQLQQQQQDALLLAQQRPIFIPSNFCNVANDYYYEQAQRQATNLPEYLIKQQQQQQQQQQKHCFAPSRLPCTAPPLYQIGVEQLMLQSQAQIPQQRQQQEKQQQQHHQQQRPVPSPTITIASTNLSKFNSTMTVANTQMQPQLNPSQSSSELIGADANKSSNNMPEAECGTSVAVQPHNETLYYNFLTEVLKLERQISESFLNASMARPASAMPIQSNGTTQQLQLPKLSDDTAIGDVQCPSSVATQAPHANYRSTL